MELVEVRELEGPNLFLLEPAIKIEVHTDNRIASPLQPLPHPYAPTTDDAPDDVRDSRISFGKR